MRFAGGSPHGHTVIHRPSSVPRHRNQIPGIWMFSYAVITCSQYLLRHSRWHCPADWVNESRGNGGHGGFGHRGHFLRRPPAATGSAVTSADDKYAGDHRQEWRLLVGPGRYRPPWHHRSQPRARCRAGPTTTMEHCRGQDNHDAPSSWSASLPARSQDASGASRAPPAPQPGCPLRKSHTHASSRCSPPRAGPVQQPVIRYGDLALTSTRLPGGGATVEVARRQPDGTWRWVIDQPALLP
jgi:hypothetical protein